MKSHSDIVSEAKERAARTIAKAEREAAILDMLPEIDGQAPPMVVLQAKGLVWLCYRQVATFADILRVFDAYTHRPAFITKAKGWAARVDRAEIHDDDRETIISDAYAWVEMSGDVDNTSRASFRIMSELPDGAPAEIHVDIDAGHWNKGAKHHDLFPRFTNLAPSAYVNKEYRCSAPAFLAQAASVFGAATHRRDGGAGHWKGVFMTRDCLSAALETLTA